jgi:hypothetical protein
MSDSILLVRTGTEEGCITGGVSLDLLGARLLQYGYYLDVHPRVLGTHEEISFTQPVLVIIELDSNKVLAALELSYKLKSSALTAHIPVLVVSNISEVNLVNQFYQTGVSYYIHLMRTRRKNSNIKAIEHICDISMGFIHHTYGTPAPTSLNTKRSNYIGSGLMHSPLDN